MLRRERNTLHSLGDRRTGERFRSSGWTAVLVAVALGGGCGTEDTGSDSGADDGVTADTEGEEDSDPTERQAQECQDAPVITYDTFGRGFLASYCDGCHAASSPNRQGAPAEVTFDSRAAAAEWADRILARSAPPDGAEATMPPAGGITPDDRERLELWLNCWL